MHLLGFAEMAARLVAAAPADLKPLHAFLIARPRPRLSGGRRSARVAALTRESPNWRKAQGRVDPRDAGGRAAGSPRPGRPGPRPGARIQRASQAAETAAVTAAPEEDPHMLRKRGKELRYLLEFFAALHDPATHRRPSGT